jgi:hypothetical protein
MALLVFPQSETHHSAYRGAVIAEAPLAPKSPLLTYSLEHGFKQYWL